MGPDPKDARTPAEFTATMRRLRSWADLSYRQLERKAQDAGDVLPRATVSGALTRGDLPREELLIAFVRACGGDAATVAAWVDARRRLAMSEEAVAPGSDDGAQDAQDAPPNATVAIPTHATVQATSITEHPEKQASPTASTPFRATSEANEPSRRNRILPVAITGAGAIAGVLLLIALWPGGNKPDNDKAEGVPPANTSPVAPTLSAPSSAAPSASPSSPGASASSGDEGRTPAPAGAATQPTKAPTAQPTPAAPAPAGMPKAGWVRMHPASSSSLCITEGRERNGRTDREIAVQRPCTEAPQPRVYLESLGNQTYRIQWHHPEIGKGCLGVDEAPVEGSELMSPRACTNALGMQYRLEPSGSGHRLRPMDSGMCIGILSPRTDGAEAIQAECTGAGDQVFHFSAV